MEKRGSPDAPLSAATVAVRPISSEQVADYLHRHPDFLIQHPELLAVLTPPSSQGGGNVVDMQQFMLQRLRQELGQLKTQQRGLIAHSRTNLLNQSRVHAAGACLSRSTQFRASYSHGDE